MATTAQKPLHDDPNNAAYLAATAIIDKGHEAIIAFADRRTGGKKNDLARVIALYYGVRDEVRYDPYTIDLSVPGLKASNTLAAGRGWCVSKGAILAACCRAIGIPARLGYADVRNHLSTARMRESMGTDVFIWHGYTDIWLDGKWVKATPAFNLSLCEKFGLKPLEFDGREDSIFHPFDLEGRQHMEYLNFRGEYADVPFEQMKIDFEEFYPTIEELVDGGDFDTEVEREVGKN
jgi:transglutaminase-like putative cysteine protease